MLESAMHFAVDAHAGQRRKGDGMPAILHAMEAAAIAATLTEDVEVLSAAVLHDAVEDAGVSLEEIRARYGPRVAALVGAETEDKRRQMPPDESWRVRKQETLDHLRGNPDVGVAMVILGDKLSNMRALCRAWEREGAAMWASFHQRDPEEHHWYYRSIADNLAPLRHTAAWREYDALIRNLFGEPARQ